MAAGTCWLSSLHLGPGLEQFVLDTRADRVPIHVAVDHRVQTTAVILVPDYLPNRHVQWHANGTCDSASFREWVLRVAGILTVSSLTHFMPALVRLAFSHVFSRHDAPGKLLASTLVRASQATVCCPRLTHQVVL